MLIKATAFSFRTTPGGYEFRGAVDSWRKGALRIGIPRLTPDRELVKSNAYYGSGIDIGKSTRVVGKESATHTFGSIMERFEQFPELRDHIKLRVSDPQTPKVFTEAFFGRFCEGVQMDPRYGAHQLSVLQAVEALLEKKDVAEWNMAKRSLPKGLRVDLSGCALGQMLKGLLNQGADFSNMELKGVAFLDTDLSRAIFDGSDMRFSVLYWMELEGASFRGTNIAHSSIANCTRASLEKLGAIYN